MCLYSQKVPESRINAHSWVGLLIRWSRVRILQGPQRLLLHGAMPGAFFGGVLRGVLPIKTDLYTDAKAVMVLQRFELFWVQDQRAQ